MNSEKTPISNVDQFLITTEKAIRFLKSIAAYSGKGEHYSQFFEQLRKLPYDLHDKTRHSSEDFGDQEAYIEVFNCMNDLVSR